jgi:hypothetical protein
MSTKHLITQTQDERGSAYEIWGEILPCSRPQGLRCLRISSRWTGARDPMAFQNRAELYLDAQGTQNLVHLLTAQE